MDLMSNLQKEHWQQGDVTRSKGEWDVLVKTDRFHAVEHQVPFIS